MEINDPNFNKLREKQRKMAQQSNQQKKANQAANNLNSASSMLQYYTSQLASNQIVMGGSNSFSSTGPSGGNWSAYGIANGFIPGGPFNQFNQGEIVVLASGIGRDVSADANPIWGKDGMYIRGIVVYVDNNGDQIKINWESGWVNLYDSGSSSIKRWEEVKNQKPKDKKKIVLDTEKLDPWVMKPEVKSEIIAVLKQHHHADKLFNEWGLGEMIQYGRGMTLMFYGDPGTGKTWAANCISKALGLDLLIIGAGEIQSSEPGGANRAIQEAFKTATTANKILFIDECDSLITARNDVGMILSSEINTLLTEIEKFEGVLILATNRIDTMDPALERRISLIVEFPRPTYAQREEIWTRMIPKKMPLDEDVKIDKLAEANLTGGQIKNVVLQAARLALAEDAKKVEAKHFDSSIERIKSSRDLMGSRSRYHQQAVEKAMTNGVKKE